jgi:hypothetical protein
MCPPLKKLVLMKKVIQKLTQISDVYDEIDNSEFDEDADYDGPYNAAVDDENEMEDESDDEGFIKWQYKTPPFQPEKEFTDHSGPTHTLSPETAERFRQAFDGDQKTGNRTKKKKTGSTPYSSCGNLVYASWFDKRLVHMLSNCHPPFGNIVVELVSCTKRGSGPN